MERMNYIRVSKQKTTEICYMKKTRLLLLLVSVLFVACGEYYGYDADDADSPYLPKEGVHIVKSVKTTSQYAGREYSWEHNFQYDAKNRIKGIDSKIVYHVEQSSGGVKRFYRCNRNSTVQYYYLDNALDVKYSVSFEYPEYPAWNVTREGTDEGIFDVKKGLLSKHSSLDFEYSGMTLVTAYSDGGRRYEFQRDRDGNVTGYRMLDNYADTVMVDKGDVCRYSYKKNNTNFDFSGYFGFWGVEEELVPNGAPYYAAYQLAAFGFLGTTSQYLPNGTGEIKDGTVNTGKWEVDENGRPSLFTDISGRKTVVTYFDR